MGQVEHTKQTIKALCVARHQYLCEHLARFFSGLGLETLGAVGIDGAVSAAAGFSPDGIIGEYELLTTLSLEAWEHHELLSRTAVIAVSLTRRPHEAHRLDVNGIAGFLYLPQLEPDAAMKIVSTAAASTRSHYSGAPLATSRIGDMERASS
jgi:hypothetical protein